MADTVEFLVVGAGVIGLSIARRLARMGREVLLVESGDRIGAETSSRNSEVIHAGLYYPPGSLKARLCVEGRKLLYDYCNHFSVPHRRLGKYIVAVTESELPRLRTIHDTAIENGVSDLAIRSRAEIERAEPAIACVGGLFSPSTGIVDSGALMLALEGEFESHGGMLALRTRFDCARLAANRKFLVSLATSEGQVELLCDDLINAAGHGAHKVAARVEGLPQSAIPPQYFAKGNYCTVSGRSPFQSLVYPVPVPGALGTHVTLDMQGAIRLGPDIEWVNRVDYSVAEDIAERFAESCRRYWPGIVERSLAPSYCGVRPKIHGPDEGFADFWIDIRRRVDAPGVVNLFGMESPGLTSSLAVADYVVESLRKSYSARETGPVPQQ
jgi:L-2-hydroxyglutarate oxidase LhgO